MDHIDNLTKMTVGPKDQIYSISQIGFVCIANKVFDLPFIFTLVLLTHMLDMLSSYFLRPQ